LGATPASKNVTVQPDRLISSPKCEFIESSSNAIWLATSLLSSTWMRRRWLSSGNASRSHGCEMLAVIRALA
jgi:hypothetical protein